MSNNLWARSTLFLVTSETITVFAFIPLFLQPNLMCLIKPYHSSFLSISLDCECSFTARKRWSIKQKSVKIHRIRKRDVFIFNESFLHTRATTHLHNPYMRLIFYPSNSIPFLISPLYSLFSIFAFLLCGYWMSLCCCCFFYSIHSFICVSRDLLFGILRCVFLCRY